MKRRDFFKGMIGSVGAGCFTLLSNKSAQVLQPTQVKGRGILTVPQALRPEEIQHLSKSWDAAVRSGKQIILTGGMKYEVVHIPEQTEIQTA